MNRKMMRTAAIALGFSTLGFGSPGLESLGLGSLESAVYADNGYVSPARWNNFRVVSDQTNASLVGGGTVETLPPAANGTPEPMTMTAPQTQPRMSSGQPAMPAQPNTSGYSTVEDVMAYPNQSSMGMPYEGHSHASGASDCNSCQSGQHVSSSPYGSPHAGTMGSPWNSAAAGSCGTTGGHLAARPSLFPWFGNAGLLFFNMDNDTNFPIATGLGNGFNTGRLDPGSAVGFETGFGRYLGCGQYGIGVNYMQWNPGAVTAESYTTAGSIRAAMPSYNNVSVNLGQGPLNLYGLIDDYGTGVWAQRDLSFQGVEVNVTNFGLMGAQRAAYANCGGGGVFGRGGLGAGLGLGGAAGPLVRANSGRLRVRTTQGFRWFQIRDDLQYAFDTAAGAAGSLAGTDYAAYDGAGLPEATIVDEMEIENNLFGYQFGGMLTYCLGNRLDLNLGGKFGVYGNHVEMEHCIYTDQGLAYITAGGVDDIHTTSSDTVLSTLGELDLGLGYRLTNAFTVRGGYRVLGVSGVASAVSSSPRAYTTLADASQINADDSFVLHGAYVGLDFNW